MGPHGPTRGTLEVSWIVKAFRPVTPTLKGDDDDDSGGGDDDADVGQSLQGVSGGYFWSALGVFWVAVWGYLGNILMASWEPLGGLLGLPGGLSGPLGPHELCRGECPPGRPSGRSHNRAQPCQGPFHSLSSIVAPSLPSKNAKLGQCFFCGQP